MEVEATDKTQTEHKGTLNLIPWKAGVSGNPAGRPKGSRSKLSEDFLADLYEDYQAHGKGVIAEVRRDHVETYFTHIMKLLPRDFKLEVSGTLTRITHSIISANSNKALPDTSQEDHPILPGGDAMQAIETTVVNAIEDEETDPPPTVKSDL